MARQRGILEEVLIPLYWRLADFERHFPKSASTDQLFLKTKGDVEDIKSIFQFAEKQEAEAISGFEEVSRLVDDLLIIRKDEEIRPPVDSCVVQIPQSTSEIVEEAAETTESESILKKLKKINDVISQVKNKLSTALKERSDALEGPADDSQQSQPLVGPDEREENPSQKKKSEAAEMRYLIPRFERIGYKQEICLLFLSAIPENKFIEKTLLIHWWIGEGLVATEEDAEICLGELISLDLIHPIYSPWNSQKVVRCRSVHMLKNLISPLLKDYFLPSKRACLSRTDAKTDHCDWKELVSVYNISSQYLTLEAYWFKGNKRLTVMQLGRWQDDPEHYIHVKSSDFLQCLSWCTKLRYLSLRGILGITELPDSIANLTNLIILDLRACQRLEKLPAAITCLRRLTHLDVSECYLLDHIPSGIECLLELQVLKGFVIGDPRSKHKCGLRDLVELQKLRKLSIVILQEACLSEGEFYGLEHLIALRSLSFRWAVASDSNTKRTRQLFAPPNLEKLVLQCVPEQRLEDWMSTGTLGKLKKLYIWGVNWASLGNGLTTVEVLRLKCLENLRIGWADLQYAFPNLSCIQLYNCPRITSPEEGLWIKSNGSWSRKNI